MSRLRNQRKSTFLDSIGGQKSNCKKEYIVNAFFMLVRILTDKNLTYFMFYSFYKYKVKADSSLLHFFYSL